MKKIYQEKDIDMGLFDYIQTDLTLPTLPESTENGRTVKSYPFKKGHQFQTKDLHNYMGEFKIGDDNQLYELKNKYEERELTEQEQKDRESTSFWSPMWDLEVVNSEWVKVEDITGYVQFYDIVHDYDDENDAWITYEIHVVDGRVQDGIKLAEFDLHSSAPRIESNERLRKTMKERAAFEKKWRYRFFGKQWNSVMRFCFSKFYKITTWIGSLGANCFKLERKITF